MISILFLLMSGILLYWLLKPASATRLKDHKVLSVDQAPVLQTFPQLVSSKNNFNQNDQVIVAYHPMKKSVKIMANTNE
jgi:hypothetical protein